MLRKSIHTSVDSVEHELDNIERAFSGDADTAPLREFLLASFGEGDLAGEDLTQKIQTKRDAFGGSRRARVGDFRISYEDASGEFIEIALDLQ